MPRKGAIRLGDPHTGGGSMIEASGFPVNGKPQCLLGDKAQCPTHLGTFPLVSSGDSSATFNGHPMAFEPAQLACGCEVSSTCTRAFAKA